MGQFKKETGLKGRSAPIMTVNRFLLLRVISIVLIVAAFAEDATIKWENVEPGIRRSTHCDFPGTELIRTVRSTNLTECENKCQFTDGCTHFVWNQVRSRIIYELYI